MHFIFATNQIIFSTIQNTFTIIPHLLNYFTAFILNNFLFYDKNPVDFLTRHLT